jgi:hypothetical protein
MQRPTQYLSGVRTPLPRHPLKNKRRTIDNFHSLILASVQKTNDMNIHECHIRDVQHNPRIAELQLRFQFLEILRLQSAYEAEGRALAGSKAFDLECQICDGAPTSVCARGRPSP